MKTQPLNLRDRFLSFVAFEPNSGCWLWDAAVDGFGYGMLRIRTVGGRGGWASRRAHRVMFEHVNGPIGPRLILCHRCDVPACVNPAHLEPVTRKENQRRGFGPSGIAFRRNTCANGHPWDDANTYTYTQNHIR